MKHQSVPMLEHPCEFINITPINPLISKCEIKVCYVGDEPNRNRSIITKEVAKELANSLPGSPIVGYYNEAAGDFEEHNRIIDISGGKVQIKDTTRPYGFVDLGAKVWFQKFLDDGKDEREYLMTEGYLWTGQYPEAQRIIDEGNNQSMELSNKFLDATWTKDINGKPKFFIINEAIIEKLCILGEDNEPCFEGSHITAPQIQFSFDDGFKQQMFAMMNELKDLLKEGGAKEVFTRYAVEIGDALWSALYSYIECTYPDAKNSYCSLYRVEGVFEENEQKFAVLQNRVDMKYYRLNFTLTDDAGFVPSETLVEVTKSYTPAEEPQFALDAVEEYETEYAKKKAEEKDKDGEEDQNKNDNSSEGKKDEDKKCPECGKPVSECTCEEDKKKKYSLDDIPEYGELQTKYSDLETKYNALVAEKETLVSEKADLEAKLEPLVAFKAKADKEAKEAMIAKFYMLSDDDKKDVVDNIDTYSVDDIEAKLSVICVRNKVSFNLDEDNGVPTTDPTTFSLENGEDDSIPAWVKRAMSVAKTLK